MTLSDLDDQWSTGSPHLSLTTPIQEPTWRTVKKSVEASRASSTRVETPEHSHVPWRLLSYFGLQVHEDTCSTLD